MRAGAETKLNEHFVIETNMMSEALAQSEVSNLGFDVTWLNTRIELRTKNGRRVIITSLFPSYIFVAFDRRQNYWKRIIQCRGVKQILGSTPDKPQPLPAGALDLIRSRFAAGEFSGVEPKEKKTEEPKRVLQRRVEEGDLVLVEMGSLGGKVSGVCTMSAKDRVKVLMEFMGGLRQLEFASSRVTLATSNISKQLELA